MFKKLISCASLSLICVLLIAGCGRKGALEPPPSAQIDTENGTVEAEPQQDKPFILDRLIQ